MKNKENNNSKKKLKNDKKIKKNLNDDRFFFEELGEDLVSNDDINKEYQDILDEVNERDKEYQDILDEVNERDKEYQDILDEINERDKEYQDILDEIKKNDSENDWLQNEPFNIDEEVIKDVYDNKGLESTTKRSDEQFLQFIDVNNIKRELEELPHEIAPNLFKEKLFGAEKTQNIKTKFNFINSLEWLFQSKPGFAVVGMALLIMLILSSIDKNLESNDQTIVANEEAFKIKDYANTDESTKNDLNMKNDEVLNPLTEEEVMVASDLPSESSIEYDDIIFRTGEIYTSDLFKITIEKNILLINQYDDLERDFKIYRNNKMIIRKNYNDFEKDSKSLSSLKIELDKGIYRLEISFFDEIITTSKIEIK